MSLTESRTPRLLVFAGPNGSGKSTVTKGIPLVGLYVNADDIKRSTNCSDIEAAQEADLIRNSLLAERLDFTFETVLSTDRNLNLLHRAKEAGYRIHAVFVLTIDPEINVQRVQNRVASGGHDVPEEKIRSRYSRSLGNLSELVRIADMTRVLDNSGEEPNLICEVRDNTVTIWDNEYWSKEAVLALLAKKTVD
ncbi:MAG: zeta toxin family protein [Oscillospiraceae bacterium]|nr:zeta toxin family protein [Oscillospiraceae bacterium]